MPGLVSVVSVMVAIASIIILLNPMVGQLSDVVDVGVTRRTEVIVMVGPEVDEVALGVSGVDFVAASTDHDLNTIGVEGELENFRTLDLDGSVPAEEVVREIQPIDGVGDAFIRLGRRDAPTLDRVLDYLPLATPAAILLWASALFLVAVGVLRNARRSSLAPTWARWSMVVLVPTVATVFIVAGVTAVVWPPVARPIVSSLAVGAISGREVLEYGVDWGLRALAVAWVLATSLAIVSSLTRHGRHG